MRPRTRSLRATITAVCLGLAASVLAGSAGTLNASAAEVANDRPVTDFDAANPNTIRTADGVTLLKTGAFNDTGNILRSQNYNGPWRRDNSLTLLNKRPAWASPGTALWAPSVTRASDGRFVMFYSAALESNDPDYRDVRCIGTAYNDTGSLTTRMPGGSYPGLFEPRDRPLVCVAGSNSAAVTSVPPDLASGLIDATPAEFDGQLWLTYKTDIQPRDGGPQWLTTTRLIRLDPANPDREVIGNARELTRWRNDGIEENPVLIKRGNTFTLFTSRGWFRRCTGIQPYRTVYRQSSTLNFPDNPTTLGFEDVQTCGKGNADIVQSGPDQWTFLWNGHYPGEKDEAPQSLYVSRLKWRNGEPVVGGGVLRP